MEDQAIFQYQNQCYQRSTKGDIVVYDNGAQITSFGHKSHQSNELYLYQDLDFQQMKLQINS